MNKKIFVQIASYRDIELMPTIKDLYAKAKYPARINVGICLQVDPEHDQECMLDDKHIYAGEIRVIQFHPKKSTGLGKARYLAQTLLEDEDYVLQIDSHMRFEPDWDDILINTLHECDSEKPILSGACPRYTLPDMLDKNFIASSCIGHFINNILMAGVPDQLFDERPERPVLGTMISAHFIFADAKLSKQVLYDPYLYFEGEEISLSARYWTHGYDIFYPHLHILYHCYEREYRPVCWDDNKNSQELNEISKERVAYLFGSLETASPRALERITQYGFGTVRTLAEYEKFIGVDFKTQTIFNEEETEDQEQEQEQEQEILQHDEMIQEIKNTPIRKDGSIFVQIASYRDQELEPTLNDMYAKAKYPARINVGICLQIDPELDKDCMISGLPREMYPGEITIKQLHYKQSTGVGLGRNIAQSLWNGEEYVLQIDSHMRFEQDWDDILINLLKECDSEKPILTAHCPTYDLPNTPDRQMLGGFEIDVFFEDIALGYKSLNMLYEERPEKPVLVNAVVGHFMFSRSEIIYIRHDPYIYFCGDETNLSVRYWTHGWDIFYPHVRTVYHLNNANKVRISHWDDNEDWYLLDYKSKERLRHFFGISDIQDPEILKDIDKYNLGTVRTLAEYEKAIGVDFKTQIVFKNEEHFKYI